MYEYEILNKEYHQNEANGNCSNNKLQRSLKYFEYKCSQWEGIQAATEMT